MTQTMEDWPLTFFLVLALESAAGAFWIGAIPPSCTQVRTVLYSTVLFSHALAPCKERRDVTGATPEGKQRPFVLYCL